GTIAATNSTLTIISESVLGGGVNFAGKLSAGTGTVVLAPENIADSISVAGGLGQFQVSTANLLGISAGTVQVGLPSDTGSITVASSLNFSGAGTLSRVGTYSLSFVNNSASGGGFSANSQTLTAGSKNLTVNVGGDVDPGSVVGGAIVSLAG